MRAAGTLLDCAARTVVVSCALCLTVLSGSNTPPSVSVVPNESTAVMANYHSLIPIAPPMEGVVLVGMHVKVI